MRKILGGAALVWLAAVACGDDGGAVGQPGGGAGEPAAGSGNEPNGQGGDPTDPGVGGGSESAGSGGTGGTSGTGGATGDGGATEPGAGAGGMAAVSTTVAGRILRSGAPIPGAVVIIDGKTALSDENGDYVVGDVSETYQLIAIIEDLQWVQIVDDLTTRTPVVNLPVPSSTSTSSTAQIAGKLGGGGGIPVPAQHATSVVFWDGGAVYGAYGYDSVGPGQSSYALGPIEFGASSATGELSALQWKGGGGGVEAFTGFATKPFTIENGQQYGALDGSVAATNLTLTDPDEVTLNGTLTIPNGMSVHQSDLAVGAHQLTYDIAPGNFSLVAPELDVSQFLFIITLTPSQDRQITMHAPRPASGDWNIVVPDAPKSVVPLNNAATVTTATEFSWTNEADGTVSEIWWGIGEWAIYRITTATKTTLPDLSAYGLDFEPGPDNAWSVTVEGPADTTEELIALRETAPWATGRHSIVGYGESRSFTLVE
jgi:hypothetical protein